MRWPRPSGLTLLSAALLVLLPTLAVLQYRWVGQVSLAERERMQRNLRNAAIQFRDSFDVEVGRAFAALQVGVNTARDGFSEPYSDRYEAWIATAEYPEIVADVFMIDAPDGALRARQWDARRHAFIDVDWPVPLDVVAPRVRATARGLRPELVRPAPVPRFPRRRDAARGAAPQPRTATRTRASATPVFGYTVVQLNRQFIVDDVLPATVPALFHSLGGRQLPRGHREGRSDRNGHLSV